MSEKISINIKAIGINIAHNFIVPGDMTVEKVLLLIVKNFQEEYPAIKYERQSSHFLMHEASGKVLNRGCSLMQSGITNGESFIIV